MIKTKDRRAGGARCLLVLLAWAGCVTAGVCTVEAQDLRATLIGRKQAEKATQLKRYTPSKVEAAVVDFGRGFLNGPNGFYPLVGSVYGGGGFSAGAGYRGYYGDNTFFDIKGLYSVENYKWVELSTDSPGLVGNHVAVRARTGWRDATQVAFFGIGIQTSEDDRTAFGVENFYAGADAELRPMFPLVLAASLAYEDYDTKPGAGEDPSIETRWEPAEVPGLGANPTFVHARVSAGIDWRRASGYARSGGRYEVRYHDYRDRNDVYGFDRLDGEVVQHLPLLREKYVISLRGRVETILNDDDQVPYFLLPSLGSGSTLRGFSSWRFRDRHGLLLQSELRWLPNRTGLDVAIFYDAGKVTARRSDLDLEGLKSDFGIGVRFHGPATTPIRVELARSNEGLRVVFASSAAF